MRMTQLKKKWPTVHWEPTKNKYQAMNYCMKESFPGAKTFIKGRDIKDVRGQKYIWEKIPNEEMKMKWLAVHCNENIGIIKTLDPELYRKHNQEIDIYKTTPEERRKIRAEKEEDLLKEFYEKYGIDRPEKL